MQGPGVCMHVLYVVVGLYRALKIVGECSANIRHTFAELVAINSESVHHTFTENYNNSHHASVEHSPSISRMHLPKAHFHVKCQCMTNARRTVAEHLPCIRVAFVGRLSDCSQCSFAKRLLNIC